MNSVIIFGAKYLIFISLIIAGLFILPFRKRYKEILLLSIVSVPLAYGCAVVLRHFFYNPRPFVVGNFKPLIDHVADNGFPSDHVLLMAVVASILFPFTKKGSLVLWILTAFVAFSRVAAGVHHALDVIGSAAIAIVVVTIVHLTIRRISFAPSPTLD